MKTCCCKNNYQKMHWNPLYWLNIQGAQGPPECILGEMGQRPKERYNFLTWWLMQHKPGALHFCMSASKNWKRGPWEDGERTKALDRSHGPLPRAALTHTTQMATMILWEGLWEDNLPPPLYPHLRSHRLIKTIPRKSIPESSKKHILDLLCTQHSAASK